MWVRPVWCWTLWTAAIWNSWRWRVKTAHVMFRSNRIEVDYSVFVPFHSASCRVRTWYYCVFSISSWLLHTTATSCRVVRRRATPCAVWVGHYTYVTVVWIEYIAFYTESLNKPIVRCGQFCCCIAANPSRQLRTKALSKYNRIQYDIVIAINERCNFMRHRVLQHGFRRMDWSTVSVIVDETRQPALIFQTS